MLSQSFALSSGLFHLSLTQCIIIDSGWLLMLLLSVAKLAHQIIYLLFGLSDFVLC